MRLHQILNETPVEITALGKMSTSIVEYIYGLCNAAGSDDLDMDDPDYDTNAHRYHRFRTAAQRRPLNMTPEVRDEWESDLQDRLHDMLNGNIKKRYQKVETTQIELGTVAEILQHMKYSVQGLSPEMSAHLGKTWIIITDKQEAQGVSFAGGEMKPENENSEDFDNNQRIELSGPAFIAPKRIKLKWLTSILMHELTHTLDHGKSNDQAMKRRDGTHKGVDKNNKQVGGDEYWKLQYEVNARFTQLAYEVQTMVSKNEKFKEPGQYNMLIQRLLTKHKLKPPVISQQQYQQILKRLTKQMSQ